jgi:glutathione S-transferase
MRIRKRAVHGAFILLLPIIVATFGIGFWVALLLVLLGLLWRWALTLAELLAPSSEPVLRLETIAASHFVEKVRWSLDRLGVAYEEEQNVGALGVFFIGRTVPKLYIRTGSVTSTIGNSSDILRYLWGRYRTEYGDRAAFLEPSAEALALETQLDRYGVWLQQWIYHHILPHRALTLHAWGVDDARLPWWQRTADRTLFPLLRLLMRRAFRLGPTTHERSLAQIGQFLEGAEDRLADGRRNLLGGNESSFVDITLAALSGLWLYPENYGAGKAAATMPNHYGLPAAMRAEIEDWRARFPRLVAHVERLYREERIPAPVAA